MEPFIGVAAYFDDTTERAFEDMRTELRQRGIAFRGMTLNPTHLTLGLYVDLEEAAIVEWTRLFCAAQSRLSIEITHAESFASGVLFAAVRPEGPLLALHRAFHARYDDKHGTIGKPYALGGGWVPHITIATQVDDIQGGLALLERRVQPRRIMMRGVSVCSFFPPVELCRFPFQ